MELTRDMLIARLDQLRTGRQQCIDNANAHNGAVQEIERLLALVEAEAAAALKVAEDGPCERIE